MLVFTFFEIRKKKTPYLKMIDQIEKFLLTSILNYFKSKLPSAELRCLLEGSVQ